jgi:hypothetical protein
LTEATTALVEELALLPQEIVINNVLPLLELPPYTYEGGEEEENVLPVDLTVKPSSRLDG